MLSVRFFQRNITRIRPPKVKVEVLEAKKCIQLDYFRNHSKILIENILSIFSFLTISGQKIFSSQEV